MKNKTLEIFQSNQILSNWFLKLLIGLMMACASISFIQLVERISSQQTAPTLIWYLPFLVFAVTMEAFATREKLETLDFVEKAIYHVAEWVIFAIILKIFSYLVIGPDHFWTDLTLWEKNLAFFLGGIPGEGEYFPILVLLFISWFVCSGIATELEVLQSELIDFKWELGKLENNRQDPRRRIAEKLFLVGGVMILVSMATRLDLKQIWGETPASQASVANVILFFLLALVFLSQTQFALLRGRWFWNQTPISPHIGKNWIRYSLLFFVLLAIIAFILPTRFTFNLLQVLGLAVNFFIQIGVYVIGLLAFIVGWIFSLFGFKRSVDQSSPPIQPPQLSLPSAPDTPMAWLELLKSILFWGIFIGIVGFSIIHFIRQNSTLLAGIRKIPGLAWFMRSLWSFWGWLKGTSKQISISVYAGLQRIFQTVPKSISREMRQFFNFKQLTPRQQIIFYYLQLIERSKKSGLNRKQHQTPNQFATDLDEVIPDVHEEVDSLTGSFVEARYSLHPVDIEQTTVVQRLWRKIAKSLKPAKPRE